MTYLDAYALNQQKGGVLKIGKYILYRFDNTNIWIEEAESGEGGQFSERDLEETIGKYYKDNF